LTIRNALALFQDDDLLFEPGKAFSIPVMMGTDSLAIEEVFSCVFPFAIMSRKRFLKPYGLNKIPFPEKIWETPP